MINPCLAHVKLTYAFLEILLFSYAIVSPLRQGGWEEPAMMQRARRMSSTWSLNGVLKPALSAFFQFVYFYI
jgi:hypothetical protein